VRSNILRHKQKMYYGWFEVDCCLINAD
jgi:hypothetical protein